jgi:hypothetical protein
VREQVPRLYSKKQVKVKSHTLTNRQQQQQQHNTSISRSTIDIKLLAPHREICKTDYKIYVGKNK